MRKIYILTDYKNVFGSKNKDFPYRSGMDKKIISEFFLSKDLKTEYIHFSDIDFRIMNFKDEIVLYTSSEDVGYHYKDYIEDIIMGLHLQGANLLPDYKYLKANNNKLFMEILRDLSYSDEFKSLESIQVGVYEDLERQYERIKDWGKYVIKPAAGAMSKGVELANNKKELFKIVKRKTKTHKLYYDIKDLVRKYYFKGYKMESRNRNKVIIQQFIPNLKNDWKVLVYGNKFYVLTRYVRKNDFRSSGSGNFSFEKDIPTGMLDYCNRVYQELEVPNLSLDVCYDGSNFYILEFQAVYFGTTTLVKSDFYFKKNQDVYNLVEEKSVLEDVYAESIVKFIEEKGWKD